MNFLPNDKCYIIAEAGVNHNGSLDMAMGLVEAAAKAGVDAVKFQSFTANELVTESAPKAEYQIANTEKDSETESQHEMLKNLELSPADHRTLLAHCKECGIEFLSTPFDRPSLELLVELGVSKLKIPSGEITNGPLLLQFAQTGLPLILSTGMSSLHDVEQALGLIAFGFMHPDAQPETADFSPYLKDPAAQKLLADKVIILHCVTEYPAPDNEINLLAVDTLREHFNITTGYSDHSEGIAISLAAAARGARIIEKHFTLDKTLPGPDHKASLEPQELTELVHDIRRIESALGSGIKAPAPCEAGNTLIARKSLRAGCEIKSGEKIEPAKLKVLRPGDGKNPMQYWALIGQDAPCNYQPGEPL